MRPHQRSEGTRTTKRRSPPGDHRRIAIAAAVAIVATTVAIFAVRDDWSWAIPVAERLATRTLGREVDLDAPLTVDLGRRTTIGIGRLELGNADWAGTEPLLVARRVGVDLSLGAALRGAFPILRVAGEEVRVALARRADGAGNWDFGRDGRGGAPRLPADIDLRDVRLSLVDPARPEGFHLELDRLRSVRRGEEIRAIARGRYQGERLAARAILARVPRRGGGRTPLAFAATAGATSVSARGWLGDGTEGAWMRVDLAARGPSLDTAWRLLGFPLPESPAFALTGRLAAQRGAVSLRHFRVRMGESDLGGDLIVRFSRGSRTRIAADVRSHRVDLDDLEGFWGRPPAEEAPGRAPVPAGARRSIFPDVPFHFPKLTVADARIRYRAERILGSELVDRVRLVATLERGRLELRPLEVELADGTLSASALVDAARSPHALEGVVRLSRVPLASLLERLGVDAAASGELGGRFALASRGTSLHDLARRLNGEAGVVLQGGRLSEELLELIALHLGDLLLARLGRDDEIADIRCVVGLFGVERGVFETRTLMLDTPHVRIDGRGTIDLARERIDLELEQEAKRFTVGALRTPIVIEGPLASRRARLAKGPLLARGGAAVALGAAIHPAAALLALVDPGSDDEPGACAAALREVRSAVGAAPVSGASAAVGPGR